MADDAGELLGVVVELPHGPPAILGDWPGPDSEKWTDARQLAEHRGGLRWWSAFVVGERERTQQRRQGS
jgi:hypothetical protein